MARKDYDEMDEKDSEAKIESFIIPQKVSAFVEQYSPAPHEAMATEVFTDARLRVFFQAYPILGVGDPLQLYIESLEANGFRMRVSLSGEPALFVVQKLIQD